MSKPPKDPSVTLRQTINRAQRVPHTMTAITEDSDGILSQHVVHDDLFLGERLIKRLEAERGWFEKLIYKHNYTVGTFYEDAVRALISETAPKTLTCGTGFIYDPVSGAHSKQLDILTYDSRFRAPLYCRGEFAIITPDISHSQAEIKKTLRSSDITEIINGTLLYNFGTGQGMPKGCSRINVLSFSSSLSEKSIGRKIAESMQKALDILKIKNKGKTP